MRPRTRASRDSPEARQIDPSAGGFVGEFAKLALSDWMLRYGLGW